MANLLLLSMSLYNYNLSEHYYTAEGENFVFCGVSQLEAGTKYFLRKLQKKGMKLDKIIVIESQEVRNQKRDVSRWLKDSEDSHFAEMTASEFYRERIIQYINGSEKCMVPVPELTEKAAAYERKALFESSLKKLYSNPENLFEIVEMGIGNNAIYKCIKTVCEQVKEIARTDRKTDLYLDMQGARRYETFVMNTAVKMLEACDVKVAESVAVDFVPGNTENKKSNKIVDATDNNVILEMVSGMNEFIKTGRGDTLAEFWQNYSLILGIKGATVENEIINQIRQISNAISLCDVERFDSNLESLKKTIEKYEKSNNRANQPLFQTFVADLKNDYFGSEHDLLPKDERRKITNQIRWCIDKKLYQQALALIVEKIPENLVDSCILYYGDEKQLNRLVNRMLERGLACPGYLLQGKNQPVKKEKAAYVWVSHIMEYRGKGAYGVVDVKKPNKYFLPSTELKKQIVSPNTEEKIGDLLKRYQVLKDQRNKVMHATGENLNVYEIKKLMVEFVNKYEMLLKDNISYDFSQKRPLREMYGAKRITI